MADRGILMSAPMVRAYIAGKKNQTRRLCPVQPEHIVSSARASSPTVGLWHVLYPWGEGGHGIYETEEEMLKEYVPLMLGHCRYWRKPGDTIYFKETWRTHERPEDLRDGILFRADNEFVSIRNSRVAADRWTVANNNRKPGDETWRSAMLIPKWAARFRVDVISVKVERLQEITEDDSRNEGILSELLHPPHGYDPDNFHPPGTRGYVSGLHPFPKGKIYPTAKEAYAELWDSLNEGFSWETNPYVYRIEFPFKESPCAKQR